MNLPTWHPAFIKASDALPEWHPASLQEPSIWLQKGWVTMNGQHVFIGEDGEQQGKFHAAGAHEGGTAADGNTVSWKASGTEKEAEAFAKNSIDKNTYYHGTVANSATDIMKNGFNADKKSLGKKLGDGVYLTSDPSTADWYAIEHVGEKGGDRSIMSMKVNVQKTFTLSPSNFPDVLEKTAEHFNIPHSTMRSLNAGDTDVIAKLSDYLQTQGYDSLKKPGADNTMVVFNPKNVMSFKNNVIKDGEIYFPK